MLYSEMIKKAIKIAYAAHDGQLDKGGYPYILHPLHVAEQMKDEESTIVAILHDCIEDSQDWSIERLKEEGFSSSILESLKVLTHERYVPYLEYIEKIKFDEIAHKVKIEDLKHNLDLSRIDVLDERSKKKLEKYKKALEMLL